MGSLESYTHNITYSVSQNSCPELEPIQFNMFAEMYILHFIQPYYILSLGRLYPFIR